MAEALRLVAICVVSAGCGALLPLRSGVFAVGALAAALAIAGADVMPVLLTTLALWTAGRVVRSRRRLIAALAERNRQLAAEQDALAELAVRQERARIARELHDIVAHHLAVMVIHAGAMPARPPGRRRALRRHRRHRTRGTRRTRAPRRAVEHGRPAAAQPRDAARPSARRWRAAPLTPLPDGVRVTPELQDSAYRVVQEGLTNAIKHAPGSDVLVRLGVHARALEVEVRDRGSAAPSPLSDPAARSLTMLAA